MRTRSLGAIVRPFQALSRGLGVLYLAAQCASCTLLDDPFEPVRVLGDAGAPLESAAPARPGLEDAAAAPDAAADGDAGTSGVSPAQTGGSPSALALASCPAGLGEFGVPERLNGLELDGNLYAPFLAADGRTLYFAARIGNDEQIFSATRSVVGTEFTAPAEVQSLNSPALDGAPWLSADGLRVYFFSDRGGATGRDLWFASRAEASSEFGASVSLENVSSDASDFLPWLSTDELTVIFVSDRPGGVGNADLWLASRASLDDPFGAPTILAELSSLMSEGRAALSNDGLEVIFSSDRPGGAGFPDVWLATRSSTAERFSAPRNLQQLNTATPEIDVALSRDGRELFFASSRSGPSELWRSVRACAESATSPE